MGKANYNEALERLPRSQRRTLLDQEARRRKSGDWPPWETLCIPKGAIGGGSWTYDIETVYRNWVFSVLSRDAGNGVTHLAISSLSGVRPTWPEAMRIKNELAGEGATAVEVYPPAGEVIDEANMYHLWVLPEPLPFSLHPSRLAAPEPR